MSVDNLTFDPGEKYSLITLDARRHYLSIDYNTAIPWEKLEDFITVLRTLRQLSGHGPADEPF